MENQRQKIELSDILLAHKDNFIKNNNLCHQQIKVIDDITKCRTSALGGHIEKCNQCNYNRHSYNSYFITFNGHRDRMVVGFTSTY